MTDVFLSYASQDRERILPLVRALEKDGFSVWWDRNIQAGVPYDRAIESAIAAAKCVVAVWSRHSIDSEYVRSEVEDAAARDILIPALIDTVQPPLAHRRRQSVDLTHWNNERNDEYEKLVAGIRATTGASGVVPPSPISQPGASKRRWLAVSVTLLIAASAGLLFYYRESVMMTLILTAPRLFFGEAIEQDVGFTTTLDGTRIAYATSGHGRPIVQVLTVGTHLQDGQSSPIYDNDGLLALSSRDNFFVRYDGRGTGLSDRAVDDFSIDARVSDLEAVVDALGLETFGILAISAGGQAAIAYTAKHPERVTRLVLAGAMASYDFGANDPVYSEPMLNLIEVGWERPEIRLMVADTLLSPDGDELTRKIVGEMLRRANDGRMLAAFYHASSQIDVRDAARQIRIPTLVIQAREDRIVPLEAGRSQAAMIPGAKLEIVDGGHMASSASTAATRKRALAFLNGGD